jgi:cellobiose phosphorylase
MNIAATQYLLGVRTTLKGVKFDPCIPADWKGYRVWRDWRGCRLSVTFENPNGVSKGVTALVVDGVRIEGNFLPAELLAGKETVSITAIMGA